MQHVLSAWLVSHGIGSPIASAISSPGWPYAVLAVVYGSMVAKRLTAAAPGRDPMPVVALAGIATLIGARLFWLLVDPAGREVAPERWLSGAGTASWGGYLGAAAGLWIGARRLGVPVWTALDAAASAVGICDGIGRISCLLVGDDFGVPYAGLFALRWPPQSLAFDRLVQAGLARPGDAWSAPTFPFQIAMLLLGWLTFAVGTVVWRRYRANPSVTFAVVAILYGAVRFVIELGRSPLAGGALHGLSTSQVMCLLLIGAGGVRASMMYAGGGARSAMMER